MNRSISRIRGLTTKKNMKLFLNHLQVEVQRKTQLALIGVWIGI